MKRLNDYDKYEQGIPINKPMVDMESGRLYHRGVRYVTWEEFIAMQDSLEAIVKTQTDLLFQAVVELKKTTLHLASLTDEPIDSKDVEAE